MKELLQSCIEACSNSDLRKKIALGPVITISRECGCQANYIATKLARILTGYNYLSESKSGVEWKVISKEILDLAARELEMDNKQVRNVFMNKPYPGMHDIVATFSSIALDHSSDQKVIETVRQIIHWLVGEGHVIILGMAANFIANDIPNHLNVRLTAPLDWRIERVMRQNGMLIEEAEVYVREIDRQRNYFVEHVAGRKPGINDYDLTFNYSTMTDDHIVDAIISVLKSRRMINITES